MFRRGFLVLLGLVVFLGSPADVTSAPDEAATVSALLRDLKSPDFTIAFPAAESLGRYSAYRAQIVPALIGALKTPDWNRCGGDMRDAIARTLGELNAGDAAVPLLELVNSGKPIDHECVE